MVSSREQETDIPITSDHTGIMGSAAHKSHVRHSKLTKKQRIILLYLEQGCSKHEAAEKMGLSVHTFDSYLREVYKIIDVHTMTAAVAKAIRKEMI